MTDSKHNLNIGLLFALGSAALFAIRPILVKLVYQQGVDTDTLIAFRMLFSVPFYLILFLWLISKTEKRQLLSASLILKISILGLFGYYLASYLDLLGLQYVTAQLGRIIIYTYPTFAVLLGALLLGTPITLRTVLALIITYAGIGLIFGHDLQEFGSDVTKGALLIIGSALAFSIYLIYSKPMIDKVGSRLFTCLALIAASIGILTQFGITHGFQPTGLNTKALWLIVAIAIFCTVIPTFLTTAAVARIGASNTGIVAMVGPGITSLVAVYVLDESFTTFHLAGIALTVFGIAILQKKKSTTA